MGKTLVIAEKPSVATDIAKVLGGMKKVGDHYEGEHYIVASAVGHLLEIKAPDAYEVKRGKWSFAHLPVIPPHFDLLPIKKSEAKLKSLSKLIKSKEVDSLINACDAGREGELIFRYIVEAVKSKKPIQRLWLQSMTKSSIQEAFKHLRSDSEMQNLAAAAKSRSEADWLVGINGTRAMTAFNSKDGGFFLTTVGRVQTPTLALVVKREEAIRQFKPRNYWEVHADFKVQRGVYSGKYFDPSFKKSDDPDLRQERIWSEEQAREIASACVNQSGTFTETSKPSTNVCPLLFDLTSLQREANSRFGFSAKTTLSLAQALYEKHKLLTYPRTDSRALPEDYIPTVKETLEQLDSPFAKEVLKNHWVKPNKRIFNNAKISDHFAIIPTTQKPTHKLSEAEQKIYDLVCRRFIANFFPVAEYKNTVRTTVIGKYSFISEGKVLVVPGWLAVYGKTAESGETSLVEVTKDETPLAVKVSPVACATKPPARYTEATLLSAMESAGKDIEESELREAISEKGIGTPATRAAIIEGLILQGYMIREGKDLTPTAKAFQLLSLLKGLRIETLSEAELTGEWEYKLAQIEKGQLSREKFMSEIGKLTTEIVDRAKSYEADTVPLANPSILKAPCPKCGGRVIENYKRYACEDCDFSITKHPGGRTFEPKEVDELILKGQFGPVDGFISKLGRPFTALLRLSGAPDYKLDFDFGNEQKKQVENLDDLKKEPPVGKCPACGGNVYESESSYVCENTLKKDKPCTFRSSKIILQQPISREQMAKLLSTGSTDLLDGFVSKRTNRNFSAYLVKDAKGKIGFKFEERAPRAKRSTTTKRTKKTA